MADFDQDDDSVVVVVGSGAGGGTIANELTQAGVNVVLLEAGATPAQRGLRQQRVGGLQPDGLARPTDHDRELAYRPGLPEPAGLDRQGSRRHHHPLVRRHPAVQRRTNSRPAGTTGGSRGPACWTGRSPWKTWRPTTRRPRTTSVATHRGGRKALPANNNYKVLANGAERIGYHFYATGPYGTNAEPYDGRPASIQDGFNFQGDKNKSKWSTLVREIPRALATGNLDLRPNSHAVQITHDSRGRADAVLYLDADGNLQRQRARVVCVAGNAIETPRLLLLSGSAMFPDGLANSSGQVGRNYMRHTTGSVYAQFDKPVNMHRGETMAGLIADESRHDPSRGFAGGYYLETLSLGVPFLAAFADPGAWGPAFTSILDGYANTAGLWVVGEDMPQESNRVTLNASVTDKHGLPVPNVHFDDHPNDVAMRNYGYSAGEHCCTRRSAR